MMRSSIGGIMPHGGRRVQLRSRARRRSELSAVILIASLAACAVNDGAPANDDALPGATPDAAVADRPGTADMPASTAQLQSCTNSNAGFTVEFPTDWQTNDGSVMPACSLFDPQPIMVQVGSEIPEDIGVVIGRESVSFDVAISDDFGRRVLSRDTTRVDGRAAVRIEAESTGDGLHDAGLKSYSYVVDLDGEVIIAQSYDAGEPDFATKKRVLDAMMRSLRVER